MAVAGPLADLVFEPAMREGGALTGALGGLFGVGPGAGMGVLIALMGLISAGIGILGYAIPAIYNAEELLPDHDQT
jgi:hypothetical protein